MTAEELYPILSRYAESQAIRLNKDREFVLDILRGRNRDAREKIDQLVSENIDDLERARFLAVAAFFHYRLGELRLALQACDQGLMLLKDGLSSDAPHDELVWLQGMIGLDRKNMPGAKAALALLRKILDANSISAMNYKPAYKHYLYLLARICAEEGKKDEALLAIKDLEWVRDKLGYWSTLYDHAFMMDGVGQILEKLGSLPDAELSYRDALSYNPQFALAHFHLGRLLLRAGRNQEARDELKLFRSQWATADANAPEIVAADQMLNLSK